jgi:hypothetical protein
VKIPSSAVCVRPTPTETIASNKMKVVWSSRPEILPLVFTFQHSVPPQLNSEVAA